MAGLFDNIKKRLGRGKAQKPKIIPENENEPCNDEYIFQLLEEIIQYDKELLRGTGIEKLYDLYGDQNKIVKNATPICTKTRSQAKYIAYINEMIKQLQRLMGENEMKILKLESDKVKAEKNSGVYRESATNCISENNQNIIKINKMEKELESKKKEVSECKNKIQNLKPQIKFVGGIPRTPQKSKQSLSPRSKALKFSQAESPNFDTKVYNQQLQRRGTNDYLPNF
jgi:hypothetical protein